LNTDKVEFADDATNGQWHERPSNLWRWLNHIDKLPTYD
jgi:hypothetical protein